jgi:hypothetical protein
MTNKPMTKKMLAYVTKFTEDSQENFDNGKSDVYMLYKYTCTVCHKQFDMFEEMGIKFDGKGNKKMLEIASRIYPIELTSKFGAMMLREAKSWSREIKDPNVEIKYTPTFFDAKTHEIIVIGGAPMIGAQEKEVIVDMLDPKKIEKRRSEFAEMVKSKGKMNCDAVACGLDDQVTLEKAKESQKKKVAEAE